MNQLRAPTSEECISRILAEFPPEYLRQIKNLNESQIRFYDQNLDHDIISTLINWLHHYTDLCEICGMYGEEELAGMMIYQLWRELNR